MMFLEKNLRGRNKIYKEVMDQVSRSSIPIRSDRQNPRIKRIARAKYKKIKIYGSLHDWTKNNLSYP